MADIRVAVLEDAARLADRFDDLRGRKHRAHRLVAAAETLGDGHQVRYHAFLLARMQRAGAPHAAHHLVEDEEDAVAVADLAHAPEIAGCGRHRPHGGADHGLGDEADHVARPDLHDRLFELTREPLAALLRAFPRAPVAILVSRRYTAHLDEQRG